MRKIIKNIDSQFLVRVVKDEVSPEEKEYFQSWLNESDRNKEYFGDFLLLWERMDEADVPIPPDQDKQWEAIQSAISEEGTKPVQNNSQLKLIEKKASITRQKEKFRKRKSAFSSMGLWMVRAAAIIIISLGAHYFLNESNLSSTSASTSNLSATPKMYERITAKGERATVHLGDGSVVFLNSASKLTYPSFFSDKERKVALIGEAYFEVAPNKEIPFRVEVDNTFIEVVGTEFNIRYRNDKLQVVVTKGVVKTYVENSTEKVRVKKGEMVRIDDTGDFTSPQRVDVSDYIAWRNNRLVFRNTLAEEVFEEIEIFYNVKIEVRTKNIKNKNLTGIFSTESLDEVLSAISISMDVEITRKGRNIIVE